MVSMHAVNKTFSCLLRIALQNSHALAQRHVDKCCISIHKSSPCQRSLKMVKEDMPFMLPQQWTIPTSCTCSAHCIPSPNYIEFCSLEVCINVWSLLPLCSTLHTSLQLIQPLQQPLEKACRLMIALYS